MTNKEALEAALEKEHKNYGYLGAYPFSLVFGSGTTG